MSHNSSFSRLQATTCIDLSYLPRANKFPAASSSYWAIDWTRYKFTRNPPSTYRGVQPVGVLTRRIRPLDPNQSLVNAIGWVG